MGQILHTHPDNHQDLTQAWMCLIHFDKLVAHSKTDPSISLNAAMRQRLRHAASGEWSYLAHDVLDRWPRDVRAAHAAKDPAAQAARRVQRLATRGNFAKAAQAALAPPRQPPTATELTKLKDELNFSNTLCPASNDPIQFTDSQINDFHRHASTRLRKADTTASGGLPSSPAGMWKPLEATSDGVHMFARICFLIATGSIPPLIRHTLNTAELIAKTTVFAPSPCRPF